MLLVTPFPSVRPSDHPSVPPSIDFHCLHRSLQLYADLYVRYTPLHAVYDLYAAIRYLYADIRRAIRNLYADIRYTQLYVRRPSILASPHMIPPGVGQDAVGTPRLFRIFDLGKKRSYFYIKKSKKSLKLIKYKGILTF